MAELDGGITTSCVMVRLVSVSAVMVNSPEPDG